MACKWFGEAEIPFTAIYGTALQLYRDGALVKHDDDVDILIHMDDRDAAEELLTQHGYYSSHLEGFTNWMTVDVPGGAPLGVYVDSGDAKTVCVQQDSIAWPRGWLEPTTARTLELDGESFPIHLPGHMVQFLKAKYGPDWNVTQDTKGDPSEGRQLFTQKCKQFVPAPPPTAFQYTVFALKQRMKMATEGYRRVYLRTMRDLRFQQKVVVGLCLASLVGLLLQLRYKGLQFRVSKVVKRWQSC
jgi:hypothetical protein